MRRVAIPNARSGSQILRGAAFHYLAHVLRVHPGQRLEAFDGEGRCFDATVVEVGEEMLELMLGEPRSSPTLREVVMALALTRGEAFAWAIQKCTELGASRLLPLAARRSVVRIGSKEVEGKRRRWQEIAASAARQSGRGDVPLIGPIVTCESVRAHLPNQIFVLDSQGASVGLRAAISASTSPGAGDGFGIVVGPEGGWEPGEISEIPNAVAVRLGPSILRSDTAAVVALTVARAFDGTYG